MENFYFELCIYYFCAFFFQICSADQVHQWTGSCWNTVYTPETYITMDWEAEKLLLQNPHLPAGLQFTAEQKTFWRKAARVAWPKWREVGKNSGSAVKHGGGKVSILQQNLKPGHIWLFHQGTALNWLWDGLSKLTLSLEQILTRKQTQYRYIFHLLCDTKLPLPLGRSDQCVCSSSTQKGRSPLLRASQCDKAPFDEPPQGCQHGGVTGTFMYLYVTSVLRKGHNTNNIWFLSSNGCYAPASRLTWGHICLRVPIRNVTLPFFLTRLLSLILHVFFSAPCLVMHYRALNFNNCDTQ